MLNCKINTKLDEEIELNWVRWGGCCFIGINLARFS